MDFINEDGSFSPMVFIVAIIAIVEIVKQADKLSRRQHLHNIAATVGETVLLARRLKQRSGNVVQGNETPPIQRRKYNHERALQCVHDDWTGPTPLFDNRQFERTFRVTRKVANYLLEAATHASSFFREGLDIANRRRSRLHDRDNHIKLRCAIIKALAQK
jgi:hypothetical protein